MGFECLYYHRGDQNYPDSTRHLSCGAAHCHQQGRSRLPLALRSPFHTTPLTSTIPLTPPQLVLFSVRHRLLLSSSSRSFSCISNTYLFENSCPNRNSVVGFFHRYRNPDYPPFTTINPTRPSLSTNTLWVTRRRTPSEKTPLKHTIWIPKWKMSGNPHRLPP